MKRDSSQQHLAGHSVRELALRFRSAAGGPGDDEAQAHMVGILSLPAAPGPRSGPASRTNIERPQPFRTSPTIQ